MEAVKNLGHRHSCCLPLFWGQRTGARRGWGQNKTAQGDVLDYPRARRKGKKPPVNDLNWAARMGTQTEKETVTGPDKQMVRTVTWGKTVAWVGQKPQ